MTTIDLVEFGGFLFAIERTGKRIASITCLGVAA